MQRMIITDWQETSVFTDVLVNIAPMIEVAKVHGVCVQVHAKASRCEGESWRHSSNLADEGWISSRSAA